MRRISTLFFCFLSFTLFAQNAKKLHESAIVVDTHNDFLSQAVDKGYNFEDNLLGKAHSDLGRMIKGGLDVQIFSVWCDARPDAYAFANREIDSLYAIVKRSNNKMAIAYTSKDIMMNIKNHKQTAMMGMEGGHMIEDDINKLDSLYNRGVRYMTLTWNNSTSWASSAMEESNGKIPADKQGLNDLGKKIINRMNQLGMMVDLSHVGEQTFKDAIATTTKPVIVSHSCVWNIDPVFRNLKDYQIDAIKKNGGVICINFNSGFLDSNYVKKSKLFYANKKLEKDSLLKTGLQEFFVDEMLTKKYKSEIENMRPPFSALFDNIDYIAKRIGVDYIGLGSDFDGITSAPKELDGIQDFPKITQGLLDRGYSPKDITKILGGNVLRVFGENSK
jgi:membrane dipeptidase